MKLTIFERLTLLGLLPLEGDYSTLKVIGDCRSAVGFSDEEVSLVNLRVEADQYKWETVDASGNPLPIEDKDIEFGNKAISIIVDALESLNSDKRLHEQHMTLYEKFIGD